MTWNTHPTIQVQNIVSQLSTDMQATGWTLYDNVAGAPVLSSTNNQGATQYVQITQGGTYQYIQFQAWLSWNASTHVGTSGTGTTYRMYFAGSVQVATTTVDLYTSVTANRLIAYVNGVASYRHWVYFGGLDTLAGVNDPSCILLASANGLGSAGASAGTIQNANQGGGLWTGANTIIPSIISNNSDSAAFTWVSPLALVAADSTKYLTWPIYVSDGTLIRGGVDGVLWIPASLGAVAHLDTISIGGVTYLVIQPGGFGAATNSKCFATGNYVHFLALAEV